MHGPVCHAVKVVRRTFDQRPRDLLKIIPNQCEFLRNKLVTDAVNAVRLYADKCKEKHANVCAPSPRLPKVFWQIPHEFILWAVAAHEVPEECVK